MSKFSLRKRIQSFRFAFRGIGLVLRYEHNAWIHLFATIVVIGFGLWLKISRPEWLFLILCIGMVFMAEGFNTAIEHLSNAVTREENSSIKKAKDVAAGAVLMAAIVSASIGLLIFIPHLLLKFNG
ncbi:MAG: diacylglycerol kinase family protein [Prolixibacteraceae bacterium]